VYDTELLARMYVTRADDPDYRPHDGMVAACEVSVADGDGTVVERRSQLMWAKIRYLCRLGQRCSSSSVAKNYVTQDLIMDR